MIECKYSSEKYIHPEFYVVYAVVKFALAPIKGKAHRRLFKKHVVFKIVIFHPRVRAAKMTRKPGKL
jgi:hypothetical protein